MGVEAQLVGIKGLLMSLRPVRDQGYVRLRNEKWGLSTSFELL